MGLLVALCSVFGTVIVGFCVPFISPFLTDWRLDSEVLGVAMDWRDFGEDKAKSRLGFELQRQKLASHVHFEDCTFNTDADQKRTVTCAWTTEVVLPLIESKVPLSFSSVAIVSTNGDISTW